MADTDSMYLENLDPDAVAARLKVDPIVTANDQLEAALRPVLDSAAGRGIPDLRIVVVDRESLGPTDLRNFANDVVARDGGTVIVRSPFTVDSASDTIPRAALERANWDMMEEPRDYPGGLDAFIEAASDHALPWADYSLVAGIVLVVVFLALMAFWWRRSHR